MATYSVGVDIGGTFTDAAVLDEEGRVTTGKAPSTPPDFSIGFFDALEDAARVLGLSVGDLLENTHSLVHATTTATNAIVQDRGSQVGLLTTRGHGEVISIMRGAGRSKGLEVDDLLYLPGATKPPPLVPPSLVREVTERIDCRGEVVVPLDEDEVRASIAELLEAGAETIAVGLLWSVVNPAHEERVRSIAEDVAPGIFVSCSHEITPRIGEYYRFVATVLNSALGPIVSDYMGRIADRTLENGYQRPVLMAQCIGGVATIEKTRRTPLLTLDSGPVSGVVAANYIGEKCGYPNIVTADMGGTTFDVSVVADNKPRYRTSTNIRRFEMSLPMVDVQSVGAGGGSIAWIDKSSGTMKVGPHSAGADPGPVCYGRGGTEPTVTDADVVLGVLNPNRFLGGEQTLDSEAAYGAVEQLGAQLGLTPERTAAGIVEIIDNFMAEKIRRMCAYQGHDLRRFTIMSFGGACGAHVGAIARQLGVDSVVIPMGNTASVLAALGTVSSDVRHVYDRPEKLRAPFDMDVVESGFAALEGRATAQFELEDFDAEDTRFERTASMKYGAQVFSVDVPVEVDDSSDRLRERFVEVYQSLFGRDSGYAPAGIEMVSQRVVATGRLPRPELAVNGASAAAPERAGEERRDVYWSEERARVPTAIYKEVGSPIDGPAVIELSHTTIAVRPNQRLESDSYGNLVLRLT